MKEQELEIVPAERRQEIKQMLNSYFFSYTGVFDFSTISPHLRIAILQNTPAPFVKYREVGGKKIPYIDHYYAERALNFISNFNWGCERIATEWTRFEQKTAKGVSHGWECVVEMKFWLFLNGERIERYIVSGHKSFDNPATTKADCLKSAISKANTVFARQFGVGANIIDEEGKAYNSVMDTTEKLSPEDLILNSTKK